MTDHTKTVKIYTRCTPEVGEQIDAQCERQGMTRPSDGKPVRSQWLELAIETQLQVDSGARVLVDSRETAVAPRHPFARDPRSRGERVDEVVQDTAPEPARTSSPPVGPERAAGFQL